MNDRDSFHPVGQRIGDLLEWAGVRHANNVALVFEGQRYTYAQLARMTDELAAGLVSAGVARGEHVALWMPNCVEWVVGFLALARIGAVTVPVNTSLRFEEVEYVVRQSDSTTLIVSALPARTSFVSLAAKLEAAAGLRRVIVVGADTPSAASQADAAASNWDRFERLATAGTSAAARDALRDRVGLVHCDDPVIIFYTSGTTGFPKGVVHSHKLLRNMVAVAERIRLQPDDAIVLYLPLFHVFASLAGVISFMYVGAKVVLMPRFNARLSLELMAQERATVAYGMQPTYHDQFAVPDFDSFDLSALRLCITPAPPEYVRLVSRRLAKAVTVYGMTESTAWTSVPHPDDPEDLAAETVGVPMPGLEVRVVDTTSGQELPAGLTGEIRVRGHGVMLGYYNKPAETAAAVDHGGWLHTGDLGAFTPDGYLQFRGRLRDAFRVGGENVDPVEVEAVLERHESVGLAAVIGVRDERLGEVGAAFVQLNPGAKATGDELLAFVRERLAGFKVPRRVMFVDEFPRTGSGKLQKFRLAELLDLPSLARRSAQARTQLPARPTRGSGGRYIDDLRLIMHHGRGRTKPTSAAAIESCCERRCRGHAPAALRRCRVGRPRAARCGHRPRGATTEWSKEYGCAQSSCR